MKNKKIDKNGVPESPRTWPCMDCHTWSVETKRIYADVPQPYAIIACDICGEKNILPISSDQIEEYIDFLTAD